MLAVSENGPRGTRLNVSMPPITPPTADISHDCRPPGHLTTARPAIPPSHTDISDKHHQASPIAAVDPGSVVDQVHPRALDPPPSPDQPHKPAAEHEGS